MALVLATAAAQGGQGPAARRFAAELVVLEGDLRMLQAPGPSPLHRAGLRARVTGVLGALRLLAREALDGEGGAPPALLARIDALREGWAAGDPATVAAGVNALSARYPLQLDGLRAGDATPAQRETGATLYRDYCAGCHDRPDTSRANPARSLFDDARRFSEREFIARLIGGVRGTRDIGLRNPLSDGDMAGLGAYLRGAQR